MACFHVNSFEVLTIKTQDHFKEINNTSVFSVIDTLYLLMCAQFDSKKIGENEICFEARTVLFILTVKSIIIFFSIFRCTFTKSYYGTFNEKLVKMRVLRGRKTRLYFLF